VSARAKPRYVRIGVFSVSVLITGVAVLGGVGVLPTGGEPAYAQSPTETVRRAGAPASTGAAELSAVRRHPSSRPAEPPAYSAPELREAAEEEQELDAEDLSLPADSGSGRRVVFDESRQRVWLVGSGGRVLRTYPVSGSIYDNLDPGTYQVYSRSARAIGIDDSGTMRYMVRFAHGDNAAIGFHDIPVLDGELVQTKDELGTPLSHGCIRQARPDAKALWRFAPLGTTVVVTA
jgi:lipoprotein-anchoring transpeptidase ErfK/SrfK